MNDLPGSCVFCRVVAGDLPAQVVYEDGELVAFRDVHPQAPFHVLVVPRLHLASLAEATDPLLLGRLLLAAAAVARADPFAAGGFRALINSGAEAGQTVFHLHVHVLAGRAAGASPHRLW